ncbi:GNAT family N-acetyltransferase [Bradyrhizobium ottawaense]|uniref:GNAT family N-acetyltransferase n=1 Tax=Bradyrhizobium ottawaense TaxID=931866 RepID=UPI001FEB1B68|nr:GNAT family N-acetyltransferase [Bradyrhizobium ottawaense]
MFSIHPDDLTSEPTRRLLALHLAGMHASSPPGHVFALDLSGLQVPDVTVWSVREGDDVVGIGALKELGDGGAEVKSMRTHPDHLRRGVAALLLDHIVREALQPIPAPCASRLSRARTPRRNASAGSFGGAS